MPTVIKATALLREHIAAGVPRQRAHDLYALGARATKAQMDADRFARQYREMLREIEGSINVGTN